MHFLFLNVAVSFIAALSAASSLEQTGQLSHTLHDEEYFSLTDEETQFQQIREVWTPSQDSVTTKISYLTSEDVGGIFDVKVVHSSGNQQLDAECLEALCSTPPDAHMLYRTGKLKRRTVSFATLHPHTTHDEIARFLKDHPSTGIVVHKIPMEVAIIYRDLFSTDELHQPSNLVVIDRSGFAERIEHFGASWSLFFQSHVPKNVTREQISQYATNTLKPRPTIYPQ